MAKSHATFVCQSCGAVYNRWQGKLRGLRRLEHDRRGDRRRAPAGGPASRRARRGPTAASSRSRALPARRTRRRARRPASRELDRVTGGGFVRGSVILLGGDPGIGKSTLLMQASAALASERRSASSISRARRRSAQVRLRAERLGLADAPVELAAETNVEDIVATLAHGRPPALVDHRFDPDHVDRDGRIGARHRHAGARLGAGADPLRQDAAARRVILVGHVTKDGQIAGPRVVEHMVDAVLSFEGDPGHHFRILRAVKNRFGPTDEIGVFEMTGPRPRRGAEPLGAVPRRAATTAPPGTAVFAGMEGTRPLLVEIQALVAPDVARHAAPRGGRLGPEPPVDGARGAGGAWRR